MVGVLIKNGDQNTEQTSRIPRVSDVPKMMLLEDIKGQASKDGLQNT